MTDMELKEGTRAYEECVKNISMVFDNIDENILSYDDEKDAFTSALYNIMKKKGYSADEVGEIINRL